MSDDGDLLVRDEEEESETKSGLWSIPAWLVGRTAKLTVGLVVIGLLAAGSLYLSYQLAGIIATIAYAFAFGFGLTMIPFTVLFLSPSFPGFMRSLFGKLHWILGSVAFGTVFLVQQDERLMLCPGTREWVYIDGVKRAIEGGQENLQILGWKPFGILFDKAGSDIREEVPAEGMADGGTESSIENTTVVQPSVEEGEIAIDLRRVFADGVRQMGSISIIEKAEEIIKRQESSDSRVGGWEPIIATGLGLLIGAGMGWLALGGGG